MRTIAAFVFTVFAVAGFLAVGIPAYILSFLGLKRPMTWVIYFMAYIWSRGLIAITGCTVTVEGRENIPARGGVCFVSNHVGIVDILLALAYIGRPFGFIAKKELLLIPLINVWIHILGGHFIDRKNIRKALKTINMGIQRLQKGGRMLVFPEGTRSKGQGLLPFRSGAIKLATHSLATIVPIAISGSYEVFEKDYRVHSVPVRMVFCPPINTAEMSPDERRHHLADQVRGIIETALASPP
jgi:1-acyl-sn-glycerol-3-phosphate acyltransferase